MPSHLSLQTDDATRRIEAIEQSLRGFVLGLFGALPIIGIVPAIQTLWISNRLHSRLGQQWNPGSAYLKWGVTLSALGLIVSALIIGVILVEFVLS
jgi:hypothetical protein